MLVPVGVVGWAVLFSVEAARKGPAWAKSHLRRVAAAMGVTLLLAMVATLLVRPFWLGLGAAYPVAIGAFLAWGRWRQLAMVEREIGFAEIDPRLQARVMTRLRKGLALLALLALVAGVGLLANGVPHGWIIIALVPVAGLALVRTRLHDLEASPGQ